MYVSRYRREFECTRTSLAKNLVSSLELSFNACCLAVVREGNE